MIFFSFYKFWTIKQILLKKLSKLKNSFDLKCSQKISTVANKIAHKIGTHFVFQFQIVLEPKQCANLRSHFRGDFYLHPIAVEFAFDQIRHWNTNSKSLLNFAMVFFAYRKYRGLKLTVPLFKFLL